MMPAAKMLDPMLGIDVHIVQPPGPVPPIPVPHPFVGMVFDPMDLVPILGSTVSVNGLPRAQAGSAGKALPVHIPIGGTFIKPAGDEGECFMGSSTVLAEDEPFSYLALPVLSCSDVGMPAPPRPGKKGTKAKSLMLPTTVVLPIPAGPMVLVGGAPTISMMAIAMHGIMAGLKGLRRLQRGAGRIGRAMRAASDFLRRKADDLLRRIPGGNRLRNAAHRAICAVTGHPVDIATGKLYTDFVDFELPGPIPFKWERVWYSTSTYEGPLGHGWHHSYDMALYNDDHVFILRTSDGRFVEFAPPSIDQPSFHRGEKLWLKRVGELFVIEDLAGLQYNFGLPVNDVNQRPLVKINDPNQNSIQFIYNGQRLVKIVDSARRELIVNTQNDGRINSIGILNPNLGPDQVQYLVNYIYSEQNDLVEIRDAEDHPFRFEYYNHLLVKETQRGGLNFYFEYDGHDHTARCIKTWGDGNIYYRELRYDLLNKYTEVTDSKGGVLTYEWNDAGLVTHEMDPLGGEIVYEYDDDNNKISQTDPNGNKTTYVYDDFGRLTQEIDPLDNATIRQFDEKHNLSQFTDATGASWQYQYDDKRNLVSQTDPLGNETKIEVNQFGLPEKITNPLQHQTRLLWSDRGELLAEVSHKKAITRYQYDTLGNITVVQEGRGGPKTLLVYDRKNQLVQVTDATNNTTRLQYDERGNLVRFTDPLGRITRYEYRGTASLYKRINADGTEFHYDYDTELNLIKLKNETGNIYELKYDANERLIGEIGFDGRVQRYQYDLAGSLVTHCDGAHRKTRFTRDAVGRLLEKSFSDNEVASFEYDPIGRLTKAVNSTTTVEYAYDPVGNVIGETQGDHVLEHEFDAVGNRIATKLPDGRTIKVAYDCDGLFTDIHLDDEQIIHLQRDVFGREKIRQGGAVQSNFDYDPAGRLIQHRTDANGKSLLHRQYRYDKAGNLSETHDASRGVMKYFYDPRDQLREVKSPTPEQFYYDPAGNLLGSPGSETNQVQGNRLYVFEDRRFVYDDVGNMIQEFRGKGGYHRTDYTYNHNNQMIAANVNGVVTTFAYDALGRRVLKSTAGAIREFYWDGNVLFLEGGASNQGITIYLYEPDEFYPLAYFANNSWFHLSTDIVGTPLVVSNTNGEDVWYAEYSNFGQAKVVLERCKNNLRFQGQYFDVETGLHYNRFRYYHPVTGRFVSQDPLGLEGGENEYVYAKNTLLWADPLGLKCRTGRYFEATIGRNGQIVLGRRISRKQAISRMRRLMREGDHVSGVYTRNARDARGVATRAGGTSAIRDAPHPDRATGSTSGRYAHFHDGNRQGGHVWYGDPAP